MPTKKEAMNDDVGRIISTFVGNQIVERVDRNDRSIYNDDSTVTTTTAASDNENYNEDDENDGVFDLDGLTVGRCVDCRSLSTALTSTGRCLLCRRGGETIRSLAPSNPFEPSCTRSSFSSSSSSSSAAFGTTAKAPAMATETQISTASVPTWSCPSLMTSWAPRVDRGMGSREEAAPSPELAPAPDPTPSGVTGGRMEDVTDEETGNWYKEEAEDDDIVDVDIVLEDISSPAPADETDGAAPQSHTVKSDPQRTRPQWRRRRNALAIVVISAVACALVVSITLLVGRGGREGAEGEGREKEKASIEAELTGGEVVGMEEGSTSTSTSTSATTTTTMTSMSTSTPTTTSKAASSAVATTMNNISKPPLPPPSPTTTTSTTTTTTSTTTTTTAPTTTTTTTTMATTSIVANNKTTAMETPPIIEKSVWNTTTVTTATSNTVNTTPNDSTTGGISTTSNPTVTKASNTTAMNMDTSTTPASAFNTTTPAAITTSATSTLVTSAISNPTPFFLSEPIPFNVADGTLPPPGYFNYNLDDETYGPNGWYNITSQGGGLHHTSEYKYWSLYQSNVRSDLSVNVCGKGVGDGSGGGSGGRRQSPIDVRLDSIRGYRSDDGGNGWITLPDRSEDVDMDGNLDEYEVGVCYEHHEIRTSSGRYNLQSHAIKKEIHPDKLRLVYDDDDNANQAVDGSTFQNTDNVPTLPGADFPHQWGGRIDLKRVDVRLPSAHTVEGRVFPAEYQLWHLHPRRKRAAVISVMMDVHPENKRNNHLQKALVEWQKEWDKTFVRCETSLGRDEVDGGGRTRRRTTIGEGGSDPPKVDEAHRRQAEELGRDDESDKRRDLSSSREPWDPYDKVDIMRTIHFYGYSGSLIEPPCSEFVEWHIMDKPMLISSEQLLHLQHLLFLHVDGETCRRTSTHWDGVAVRRPVRDAAATAGGDLYDEGYGVHRCTCRDFLSDEERSRNVNVTRCDADEEQEQLRESLKDMAAVRR